MKAGDYSNCSLNMVATNPSTPILGDLFAPMGKQ